MSAREQGAAKANTLKALRRAVDRWIRGISRHEEDWTIGKLLQYAKRDGYLPEALKIAEETDEAGGAL